MIDRLSVRFPDLDMAVAEDILQTVEDRIKLRVGTKKEFPEELESIAVEVASAMYNRHILNHEGVESESVDVFSVKFVKNLLDEYESEFSNYIALYMEDDDSRVKGKLRFY